MNLFLLVEGRLFLYMTQHNKFTPFLGAVSSNMTRLATIVAHRFVILLILIRAIASNMTQLTADIASYALLRFRLIS